MELLARASSFLQFLAQHIICCPKSRACHDAMPQNILPHSLAIGTKRRTGRQCPYRIVFVSDRTVGRSVGRGRSDEQTPNLCAHFSITAFLTPARARPILLVPQLCSIWGERKNAAEEKEEEGEEDDETKLYNLGPNFDKWTETDVTRRRSGGEGDRLTAEHTDLEGTDMTGPAPAPPHHTTAS